MSIGLTVWNLWGVHEKDDLLPTLCLVPPSSGSFS